MSFALEDQTPVAPPAYQRAQATQRPAQHINALTLVTTLHLLALCRLAVRLAHHRRCPLCGWFEIASQVALTYTASLFVGLAAQHAGRPDLIRSPKRVLAHLWEEDSQL